MTARQQRRREEHKARKEAYKAEKEAQKSPAAAPHVESDAPSTRTEINRANAQRSTGPRTESGKLASSRNSFKHGLYSKQLVLPGEDPAELDALRDDLRREHQPATPTEEILVNELAEHYWRLRRMRKFEARAMGAGTIEELHKGLATLPIIQRTMASAERGFHKALKTLTDLQRQRGFVPQKAEPPAQSVPQNAAEATETSSLAALQTAFVTQERVSPGRPCAAAPEQDYLEAA